MKRSASKHKVIICCFVLWLRLFCYYIPILYYEKAQKINNTFKNKFVRVTEGEKCMKKYENSVVKFLFI